MSSFLVDTNVVSELTKKNPNSSVVNFMQQHHDLWLSVVVIHELEFGLHLLSDTQHRDALRITLETFISYYQDRILPMGREEAEQAAKLRAHAHRSGRVLHLADAIIAGTAQVHNLTLATRNISDFQEIRIRVINPWEAS